MMLAAAALLCSRRCFDVSLIAELLMRAIIIDYFTRRRHLLRRCFFREIMLRPRGDEMPH